MDYCWYFYFYFYRLWALIQTASSSSGSQQQNFVWIVQGLCKKNKIYNYIKNAKWTKGVVAYGWVFVSLHLYFCIWVERIYKYAFVNHSDSKLNLSLAFAFILQLLTLRHEDECNKYNDGAKTRVEIC